jgi:hypothetical protein
MVVVAAETIVIKDGIEHPAWAGASPTAVLVPVAIAQVEESVEHGGLPSSWPGHKKTPAHPNG